MAAPVARYTLTEAVLVEASMRAYLDASDATRRRYAIYAVVSLGLWAALRWGLDSRDTYLPVIAAAFAVLAALRPWLVRRSVVRGLGKRTDLGREATVRASLHDLHVAVEGVSESAVRLATLHAVDAQPEGVLVELQPTQALWVPAHGFASPADRDAFERLVLAGAPLPDPGL